MSFSLVPWSGRSLLDRWDPWRLFDDLDFFPSLSAPVPDSAIFTPRVNVTESDEAYLVEAELPGLEEKDFEVVLEDDVLTLRGQKRDERESAEHGWRRTETAHGRFERRFRFPVEVVADAVKAEYRNGVLMVTLPKAPEARPQVRTIPIQSA
jgi:HSP20 family protein